jgi:hypothetical protein
LTYFRDHKPSGASSKFLKCAEQLLTNYTKAATASSESTGAPSVCNKPLSDWKNWHPYDKDQPIESILNNSTAFELGALAQMARARSREIRQDPGQSETRSSTPTLADGIDTPTSTMSAFSGTGKAAQHQATVEDYESDDCI